MTTKKDLTGQLIGQYRIISRLGDGTSATVYRAQQLTAFGRDVALKVMRPELVGEASFVERLETEARTIAKLNHPNILRLVEYFVEGDLVCLVMDYMPGGSLADLIKSGHQPLEQVELLGGQIAAALDYAHAHNIIHRDLKPQNVLIDGSGNANLCDFGIAKILSENTSMTRTGAIIGTPAYMSPEQWEGLSLDRRSDVYSFGIVMYELLTGELPFKADTTTSMMFQHLHKYPPPVEEHREELPPVVNRVIQRAIAKKRDERFSSATEFIDSLHAALNGLPVEVTPVSPLPLQATGGHVSDGSTTEVPIVRASLSAPPLQQQRRLSPTVLIGAAAVVIVGVFGAAALLSNGRTDTPPATAASTSAAATSPSEGSRVDSHGIRQVMVSTGCYTMGSTTSDLDASDNELPAHQVCVGSFWMDVNEVTVDAYQAFVDAGGYTDQQWWSPEGWAWLQSNGFEGPEDRAAVTDTRQPRVNLSWYEADAYARWRGGRLPTEAEWEYAARGKNERIFAWGDGYQLGYSIINESTRGGAAPTSPNIVGSRPTDRTWSGIYDMVGNACEWVSDWYGLYSADDQQDPTGPAEGTEKVIRGGNYTSSPTTARLVARTSLSPEQRARLCGVRVVSPP